MTDKNKNQAELEIEALQDVFGIATTGFESFYEEAGKKSSGEASKSAVSGNYSTSASSGNYSTSAASGNNSTSAVSGNYSKSASSGPAYRDWETDRKSTRLNSSHRSLSRMPSSA